MVSVCNHERGWDRSRKVVETPFVLGVLWHPEEDEKSQLIKALVSEVT
jgi:gamma-glutamyl-gamma-aminobutyrate hydrolase PuuD